MVTCAPILGILRAHPIEHLFKLWEGSIAKDKVLAYRHSRLRQLRRNMLVYQTIPHAT
jgi:hypothetical protein